MTISSAEQATQIDDILATILNVDGIAGTMVFDPDGALLGAQMPAVYSDDMLHEVADQVVSTLLTLKEMKIRVDDVSYTFDELRLVVCDLRKKGFLCILSQTSIGPALLNITTNVAQKKLARVLDGKSVAATRSLRTSRPPAPPTTVAQAPISSGIEPAAQAAAASTSMESATSMTGGVTASSVASSSTSIPAMAFQAPPGMDPILVVANVLLLEILAGTRAAADDSVGAFLEATLEAVGTAKITGKVDEELRLWCRTEGAHTLVAAPTAKELSAMVHSLYIFLCEYHGPVAGDRILKTAIRHTESIPAARQFTVKSLL